MFCLKNWSMQHNELNEKIRPVYKALFEKRDTPKEKLDQLISFTRENNIDCESFIRLTIKQALSQCALVGQYAGFNTDFWTEIMGEWLLINNE